MVFVLILLSLSFISFYLEFRGSEYLHFGISTVGDPVEVGKSVQARVLDVVKADRIVDLTLRPELLEVSNKETTKSKKENSQKVSPLHCFDLILD